MHPDIGIVLLACVAALPAFGMVEGDLGGSPDAVLLSEKQQKMAPPACFDREALLSPDVYLTSYSIIKMKYYPERGEAADGSGRPALRHESAAIFISWAGMRTEKR